MAEKKTPPDHEVAEAAFHLWEQEGKPDGMAVEHWHRAREMLAARDAFGGEGGMAEAQAPRATKPAAQGKVPRGKKATDGGKAAPAGNAAPVTAPAADPATDPAAEPATEASADAAPKQKAARPKASAAKSGGAAPAATRKPGATRKPKAPGTK